jgi:hypothetical protein
MQRTIEKRACFITHAGRSLGAGSADGEPSHIHLPRRRRVARPDEQGSGVTWGARASDDTQRRPVSAATVEA